MTDSGSTGREWKEDCPNCGIGFFPDCDCGSTEPVTETGEQRRTMHDRGTLMPEGILSEKPGRPIPAAPTEPHREDEILDSMGANWQSCEIDHPTLWNYCIEMWRIIGGLRERIAELEGEGE